MRRLLLAVLLSAFIVTTGASTASAAEGAVSMRLVNRSAVDLQVRLADGANVGRIAPAESKQVTLPEGRQRLLLFRADGSLYMEASVVVHQDFAWEIPSEASSIEIHNNTVKDVELQIDGKPAGRVAAGETTTLSGVRGGRRFLAAVSGGVTVASEHAEIPERGAWYWVLGQASSNNAGVPMLRVANFAGQAVQVFVNGGHRIDVRPGDSAVMVGVPAGRVSLEARSADGAVLEKTTAEIEGGRNPEWKVLGADGGRAVLEVSNQTGQTLRVCVDGRECQRVSAGQTVQFSALTRGEHTFEARDPGSDRLIESFSADVKPGSIYQWPVEAGARPES